MAYLADMRLVHRDLATRNVLVSALMIKLTGNGGLEQIVIFLSKSCQSEEIETDAGNVQMLFEKVKCGNFVLLKVREGRLIRLVFCKQKYKPLLAPQVL